MSTTVSIDGSVTRKHQGNAGDTHPRSAQNSDFVQQDQAQTAMPEEAADLTYQSPVSTPPPPVHQVQKHYKGD